MSWIILAVLVGLLVLTATGSYRQSQRERELEQAHARDWGVGTRSRR